MNDEKRDELLIRLDERMETLASHFKNHLSGHAKYTYLVIASTVGAFVSLILILLKGG